MNLFSITHLFFMLVTMLPAMAFTQITSYPYLEDFELSAGGWVAAGASSSWAWGIPAEPVINAAGSGSRCWATGLAVNYNPNELSTLTSPVFDMTSLTGPMVSFMLIWETESGWDGMGFQYSTNGGVSWSDFPVYPPSVSNCYVANWFNNSAISYNDFPANNRGWSGNSTNIAGGGCSNGLGSGGWRTATHCLGNLPANLAGQSNVRFRFTFGTGSICHDEGVAIDRFVVSESPIDVDFTANCLGMLEVEFEANSLLPGCGPSFIGWNLDWNFGDPASGVDNTGSGASASHIFTAAGSYVVNLIGTNPCGNKDTVSDVLYVDALGCILPISDVEFEAEPVSEGIELSWTAYEGKAGELILFERSADGVEWTYAGGTILDGAEGERKSGNYLDNDFPREAKGLWYRLLIRDAAGSCRYLAMAYTENAGDLWEVTVFPNPVHPGDKITAQVSRGQGENFHASLSDITGKTILTYELPNGVSEFTLPSDLVPGIYFFTVSSELERQVVKIMVR